MMSAVLGRISIGLVAVILAGCGHALAKPVVAPTPVAAARPVPAAKQTAARKDMFGKPASEEALQEALGRDLGDAAAWEALARLYRQRSATTPGYAILAQRVIVQGEEALARVGKASADLQVTRGLLALDAGKPDVATRDLEAALRLDPGHPRALLAAGRLAFEVRDFARAQRALRTLADSPAGRDDPDVWLDLGVAERRLGHHEAAGAAYRRALKLAPDDPRPHFNLGQLAMHIAREAGDLSTYEKQYAAARVHFKDFVQRTADDPRHTAQRRAAVDFIAALDSELNRGCTYPIPMGSHQPSEREAEVARILAALAAAERERLLELERKTIEAEAAAAVRAPGQTADADGDAPERRSPGQTP